MHEEEASVGGKRPRGSRERALVHVQCEPKDNDEVAYQRLPSNFAISFEERLAQPRPRASKSRDLSKSGLVKDIVAKLRPAGCSSKRRPAILLVRMLVELRASLRCLRAPRQSPEARDKARRLTPKAIFDMGSSFEAAVRCNIETCLPCVIGR